MQIHSLSGQKKKHKRVGRGGKRGTYSGRGGKGQTARAGHRIRPAIRDFIKQIPKRRGRHKHSFISVQEKPFVVSLAQLEARFKNGDTVNKKTLSTKGFGARGGKFKILNDGTRLTKKLTVVHCQVSASARKTIQDAGGTFR